MREVRLLSLELKNFKGAKKLIVEPKGKNMDIYGENETKKTTIADGWSWLISDKDTQDQSPQKFDIKPLDENNEPIHGLVTSVKATLDIDGSQRTYEKRYQEDWQKKKGSIDKVFSGHIIDRFVSGSSMGKAEFEKDIEENMVSENAFRLLTDPKYFNEQLHWKERRKILTDYIGGIENKEVFETDKNLKELEKVLEKTTAEKHRDNLRSKLNDLNDEIKKIPIRIDEVNNNLPDLSDSNSEDIRLEIEKAKENKKTLERELSGIENGGEIAEKRKQVAELDTDLQQIRLKHTEKYNDKIAELKNDTEEIKDSINSIERKIRNKNLEFKDNKSKMENLKLEINELADTWRTVNSEEIKVDNTCPTCGQELPEDQIEEAERKVKLDKSQRLENISEQGSSKKERYMELKEDTDRLDSEVKELEEELEALNKVKDDLYEDLFKLKKEAESYQDNFQYKKKLKEKENLEEIISELREDKFEAKSKIQKKINNQEDKIEELQKKLNKFDQYEAGQKRIEELKKEEEKLAAKYQELERERYLCEKFEKTKAELLEEKVNGKFKLARFKLFEKNINGSIEPTCRTIYKGVPYNTNLNNGHKVIVGVDIINTLADHYGFRAPIFIDNMESVTKEIESDSQLIKLIAKENVRELVMLKEGEKNFEKLSKVFGEDKAKEICNMKEAS